MGRGDLPKRASPSVAWQKADVDLKMKRRHQGSRVSQQRILVCCATLSGDPISATPGAYHPAGSQWIDEVNMTATVSGSA